MAGLFISFEGIDGCGKSTQVAALAAFLRERGHEPLLVREPGGTELGERLRGVLLDPATGDVDPGAEALLYAAARAQLVADVIEPALASGRVVIADRFVDSSLAYQGAGRQLGVERVRAVNELATRGRLPDVTFLLDLDVDEALRRAAGEGEPDRIEQAGTAFFAAVATSYRDLAVADAQRFVVIDATQPVEQVTNAMLDAVGSRLPAGVA